MLISTSKELDEKLVFLNTNTIQKSNKKQLYL